MFNPFMFYLCIPRRFRFLARLFAMLFLVVVFALVIALFARTLMTLKRTHGHWLLHPRSHQPLSPDFILYRTQHRQSQEVSQ